jgi:hypothetical protein
MAAGARHGRACRQSAAAGSIAQVWAAEILSRGTLYRFERDSAGLWFHHVGQHVHTSGGLVHHADPTLAPLIEAEFAVLDRLPIGRIVARHPDAAMLASSGSLYRLTYLKSKFVPAAGSPYFLEPTNELAQISEIQWRSVHP